MSTKSKTLGEVINEVQKAKSFKAKVELLKLHESKPLRQILRANFDPAYVWDLPEGLSPYDVNDDPIKEGQTTIKSEIPRLYLFMKLDHVKMSRLKKEAKWINMLEALDAQEAKIMDQIKDKKLEKISRKVVEAAFPQLLDGI